MKGTGKQHGQQRQMTTVSRSTTDTADVKNAGHFATEIASRRNNNNNNSSSRKKKKKK
jgi:hypothetical protein